MSRQTHSFPYYQSSDWDYTISVDFSPAISFLDITISPDFLYTTTLPRTAEVLEALEPRVLESKCFNYRRVPFSEEVKKTEIAHLFEHIVLEYLCQESLATGPKRVHFSGLTSWNWHRESRGVFHIKINGTKIENNVFSQALSRSIALFDTILSTSQETFAIPVINSKQIAPNYLFVTSRKDY